MKRRAFFYAAGMLISTVTPLVAVLSYFPIWRERGGATALSGFAALLLIMCAAPIIRLMKKLFASPSAWLMWLAVFTAFLMLARIADEMVVISFIGLTSNLIGAALFRISRCKEAGDEQV